MAMRGLWKCTRILINPFDHAGPAPNSDWAARGYPSQATQGCGKFNVYVGEGMRDRKIDVRCKHCGRRVKFQWKRWENRGRPRPVSVVDRPESMTRAALVSEMQARNAGFEDGVIPDTHLLSTDFSSVKVKAKPKLSPEAEKMKEEFLAAARQKIKEDKENEG